MNRFRRFAIAKFIALYRRLKQQEQVLEGRTISGVVIMGDPKNVKIGNSVSFGGDVILLANSSIEIGEHTMVGIKTMMHTSTHNYHNHPMWKERIDRPIKVGSHVWIGARVILMPGVVVEDFAVVGAGSVVQANVPKYAIVAGNPARIINYRDENFIVRQIDPVSEYPDKSFVTKQGYLDKYCKSTPT